MEDGGAQELATRVTFAALAIVVAACSGGGSSAGAESQAAEVPDELVIGFVPSSEAAQLVEDIEPLAAYLTEQLGIEVNGFVSSDYAAMVTAMQTGQAHIAALAPFGLVQAVDEAGAVIILQSERNGSATYHTQFFTTDADKYCTVSPPEDNVRVIDEADVTFLNCNGTARGNEDSPRGTDRPRGARGPRAGRDGVVRRAGIHVGIHLPGDRPPRPGHRPRERYRAALRGQP